jgi:hypothetical protein
MLKLEYPRVVLVIEVLVGDQLNVTARLGANQRWPWLLPYEGPVVRIAHP